MKGNHHFCLLLHPNRCKLMPQQLKTRKPWRNTEHTPNLSTQLTTFEILHSPLTVFYQLFRGRKAHKKYCTPGYAAVNHCIAHHLLLVKANGCCVHRSAEQHWSLSLGWFPLWIMGVGSAGKMLCDKNVHYLKIFILSATFLKPYIESNFTVCTMWAGWYFYVHFLFSPALKCSTRRGNISLAVQYRKRSRLLKYLSLNIEHPHDGM